LRGKGAVLQTQGSWMVPMAAKDGKHGSGTVRNGITMAAEGTAD